MDQAKIGLNHRQSTWENKAIHNKLDLNKLNAEVNRVDISDKLASTQEENLGNDLTNS